MCAALGGHPLGPLVSSEGSGRECRSWCRGHGTQQGALFARAWLSARRMPCRAVPWSPRSGSGSSGQVSEQGDSVLHTGRPRHNTRLVLCDLLRKPYLDDRVGKVDQEKLGFAL